MNFHPQKALRKDNSRKTEMKGSKGIQESPWSLHIGSFWKILFIYPPEVQGQVVRLKRKEGITLVKK
jgi:hypothetical protein